MYDDDDDDDDDDDMYSLITWKLPYMFAHGLLWHVTPCFGIKLWSPPKKMDHGQFMIHKSFNY